MSGPRRHRDLLAGEGLAPGELAVAVLRSESQEAAHVAARLRHAHLVDGVPWSQMAVLVRSTVHAMPVLRRAMVAAGVPMAVSGDEVPLVQEPAVRPLLLLLRCATRPETLDEETVVELLTSPVGGADVMALRRLRQALRKAELAAGGGRASGPLLVEAVDDPAHLVTLEAAASRPAVNVARLLSAARSAVATPGVTAEDVLWEVWQSTGLATRWERASRAGGPAGEAADRDLDAVVALFDTAARFCDRLPGAGPEVFLDHLLGPADPGRRARRAPAHRRRGPGADRAREQGPRVGPGLRRRGAGRRLAGPADAWLVPRLRAAGRPAAAGFRADRSGGGDGGHPRPAARGGAPAVLRGRDPRAPRACSSRR